MRTKVFKPLPRPGFVERPRLTDLLTAGLGLGDDTTETAARLILVSAPAGFGKTTLISAWLAQAADLQTAWLSLDEGDNDPIRFLAYLIAAVQGPEPDAGETAVRLLQSPQPPPVETILTFLINDLSQDDRPLILVLEDYHVITTSAVHQALAFLLDNQPPHLNLLLTTRSDPPLPLSRLRARGQIVEIRANDLRFTTDEAGKFLNQVMGLNLTREALAALEERTEGWIAGLQLAALSMQGRGDLTNFISSFTGSHRLIIDYLSEEVLNQQAIPVRKFLLATSILERVCGQLADALTQSSSGQETLEYLEQANLFLIPLDDERRWFRYHHLFGDVLRKRLQLVPPSQTNGVIEAAELHSRASAWFEQEGFIDEAIQHALAATDVERAVALVEQYSLVMFQHSNILSVRSWLERLPSELVLTRPRLILAHGWVMVLTGHGEAIEQWLSASQASTAFTDPDLPVDILGELALLRATQARYQREDARSLELALQAQELLSDDNRGLLAGALYTIAAAHMHQGDIGAASQAFAESVILGETKGGPYMALAALQELSELQVRQGRLNQVILTCQKTVSMAARWNWQSMPAVGMAHIYFGQVLYERNNLIGATHELIDGINQLRGSTDQFVLAPGYVTLSKIQMARNDFEGAFANIQRGEDWLIKMQMGDRGAGTLLALGKIRLWISQGQLDVAARWFETCQWWAEETNIGYLQRLALVRLRLAQSRLNPQRQILLEVTETLNRLLALKETGKWFGQVIAVLVLQALVSQVQGDSAGAHTSLERALRLAEPEDYCRVFLDEGEPLASLLLQARQRSCFTNYVDNLLDAFRAEEANQPEADSLPEPLSNRELEVLRLAAAGASNKEIAGRLFIALPTVKKHISNILVKLDTSNRTEAATRARELNLLP
ncbi:MAG: LuxR C-terminal-related transcriptional regulator [Candidatus Promineifilaceae bacterium]|nr:LuxR C-terminal-related transcriptional regulator [Candidatus Promineifilaceae bacterium]